MTTTTNTLRVSRTIHADRETLFRAWTDPKELRHWWRMKGDGWKFAGASIDLRVGGRYTLGMTDPTGKTHTSVGEYRTIDPPARLAFTWDWEDPSSRVGETVVTVEFIDAGNGSTEVVLTHERFPNVESMGSHEKGWTALLELLDEHAG